MTRDQTLELVGKGECACAQCRKLLERTVDRLKANGLLRDDEVAAQAFTRKIIAEPPRAPIGGPIIFAERAPEPPMHTKAPEFVPVKVDSAVTSLRRAGYTILAPLDRA